MRRPGTSETEDPCTQPVYSRSLFCIKVIKGVALLHQGGQADVSALLLQVTHLLTEIHLKITCRWNRQGAIFLMTIYAAGLKG